jgi:hypothetical protein
MFTTTVKCLTPAVLLLLAGCASLTSHHPNAQGTQLNQICQHLKLEILENSTNNVPDEGGKNPAVEARLYKTYEANHCDEVLKEKTKVVARGIGKRTILAKK